MLALALDDFSMLVVDTETRRVVRKFSGHRGNVNAMVGQWVKLDKLLIVKKIAAIVFLHSDFQP